MQTRRQFLAHTGVVGLLGLRGIHAQTPQAVAMPGVEAGEVTKTFALRDVTVIDCTGKPARPRMTVVIDGNRIRSISSSVDAPVDANVPAIDATGKYLVPGFWDMHVHITRVRTQTWDISPLFIPNGVTGVRTMGGWPEAATAMLLARAEVAGGTRLGPRMVVGSPTLDAKRAPNPEAGRQAVRNAVSSGVDFIKIYDGLARDTYFAIVDEAKRLKIPFAGHAGEPVVTLDDCVRAGQASFEHVEGVRRYVNRMTGGTFVSPDSFTASQRNSLFAVMLEHRTPVCPTILVDFGQAGGQSGDFTLADSRLKYVVPSDRQRWTDALAAFSKANPKQRYEYDLRLVGALHMAGVSLLAGTDSLSAPYTFPGFGLHDELQLYVKAGLSPMEALRTATYNPAQFLGFLDTSGTVEQGKRAELVLLDGNPLQDIENTQKINTVFTGGRMYRRAALDRILAAAEESARN